MNRRRSARRALVGLPLLALAAILAWLLMSGKFDAGTQKPNPAPDAAAGAQRVAVVNGVTFIKLDVATQVQSGIRTESLSAASYRTETAAYGTVMDLQPLIDIRTRYAAAMADTDAVRAVAAASGKEYERNRILYEDNQNVSLKVLQAAQAAYNADQARLDASISNAQSIRTAALQQLPERLVRWALDPRSADFARLTKRQEALVRVTVPLGNRSPAPGRIELAANNDQRFPAILVAAATQIDPAIAGRAFIYRTSMALAAGTHVAAYLPTSSQTTAGVAIPSKAIVWYGGQPWAYVQTGPDRFGRYRVPEQFPLNGGFIATQGFTAGTRVVTSGAQLLLSEELRPQAASSGCKDPECD